MNSRTALVAVAAGLMAAACAPSSHVLVGTARPPITPDQVKLYLRPPPRFEEVAALNASSKTVFGPGGEKATQKVIARLKAEAAKLGANGIILGGFSDAQTGSFGTGVGSDSYSRNSSISLGVGGAMGIFKKTGEGRAIYVPPGAPQEEPQEPQEPQEHPPQAEPRSAPKSSANVIICDYPSDGAERGLRERAGGFRLHCAALTAL